ncbi:MAG: DUF4440 domain-containing protein [Pseudonocardia sp.]
MSERTRETGGDVAEGVRRMYRALGDPAGFDRHLHPDITIWESDQPGPPIGLPELDALRARRRSGDGAPPPQVSVEDLLVDRWGQVAAVARYVLRAAGEGGDAQFRVTDVWEHGERGWRIVHHHAEAVTAAGEHGHAR